jgi:hypothetical protein
MFCIFIGKHNNRSWEECKYVIVPRALVNDKLGILILFILFKMPFNQLHM